MNIVPPSAIPGAESLDITGDLVQIYKVGLEMNKLCRRLRGKGLSAVQVGVPWKFFVIQSLPEALRGDDGMFVNCEYEPVDDRKVASVEGCLSLPSVEGGCRRFRVERSEKIRVRGYRLHDSHMLEIRPFDEVLDVKSDSIVFAHEIDHHRGVLISDIGTEVFLW